MIIERHEGTLIALSVFGAVALGVALQNHAAPKGDVFDVTGKAYGVEPALLRAIQLVENPKGLRIASLNASGTRDYGLMQINESNLRHYQVPENLWLDDAVSVDTAGRYMSDTRKELGKDFNIFSWIASYNIGVPNFKKYGIRSGTYTGAVYYHYVMFSLANA